MAPALWGAPLAALGPMSNAEHRVFTGRPGQVRLGKCESWLSSAEQGAIRGYSEAPKEKGGAIKGTTKSFPNHIVSWRVSLTPLNKKQTWSIMFQECSRNDDWLQCLVIAKEVEHVSTTLIIDSFWYQQIHPCYLLHNMLCFLRTAPSRIHVFVVTRSPKIRPVNMVSLLQDLRPRLSSSL